MSTTSRCYRPPSWPPPIDWVVSEDESQQPVSRWGDQLWNLSPWLGSTAKLGFSHATLGGKQIALCSANQQILRMVVTWLIWGQGGPLAWNTLKNEYYRIRKLIAFCEHHRIIASQLTRFPRVLSQLAGLYASEPEKQSVIVSLHRLLDARDKVGVLLLDVDGIKALSRAAVRDSREDCEQTAYIPPRIWDYSLARLRECLDDFLAVKAEVSECFKFCVEAYIESYGSLEAAANRRGTKKKRPTPFENSTARNPGAKNGYKYYGRFDAIADRFGIIPTLKKWVSVDRTAITIKTLSAYLGMVQTAALLYVTAFTLQRKEEAGGLRENCLIWERDPLVGSVLIVRGETTKTQTDSDAFWPTSPSVAVAVEAATVITNLRLTCALGNPASKCTEASAVNPHLFNASSEPWSRHHPAPHSQRPAVQSLTLFLQRFPNFFDEKVLTITEEDLRLARMFTPNLSKGEKFQVGKLWPLAYHQFRRTGVINMFASNLLDASSIQYILKHRCLTQSLYYGQNFSKRRFSEEVEGLVLTSMYEVMGLQLQSILTSRYVSPLGSERKDEMVLNLVGTKDFKKLIKAAKTGEVSFRETGLGACTKLGFCEYGGIESISHCAGGNGKKPCSDALFDRQKGSRVALQLSILEKLEIDTKSPRGAAIANEIEGLRNYQNACKD